MSRVNVSAGQGSDSIPGAQHLTAADVAVMARRFYEREDDNLCGILHVVLDDENIRAPDIKRSRSQALTAGDDDAVAICDAMLGMTRRQRWRVCRRI